MRFMKILCFALALASFAVAQVSGTATASAPSTPEGGGSYSGFSVHNMDTSANPCNDFYQYACGTWLKENDIPRDRTSWGRFTEVAERNRVVLHDILEKAAVEDPKRTPIEKKIGDYYASCMDETVINLKGLKPIQPELDRIEALKDKSQLPAEIAHLHSIRVPVLFRFGAGADFKDASKTIAGTDQGGLGLPDRDYYFKDDPTSVKQREQYRQHIQNMFELLGDKPEVAAREAQTVIEIETSLAGAALRRVDRREPSSVYHKMTTAELGKLSPAFDWKQYISSIDAPEFKELNVAVPDFVKNMQTLIEKQPLENWKAYLRWHLVHANASVLPTRFGEEDFDFYSRTLNGQREQQVRWKRCTTATDAALGEALGQEYVEKTFGAEGKKRTLAMISALETALKQDIHDLPWMSAETKQAALVKLDGIAKKVGYPDNWRDYSSLKVVRGDAFGNRMRGEQFEVDRRLKKIGKEVDKTEWGMTPPTVNAYYSPEENNINFPAGILQPPFYDNSMDDAVNFGGIGVVIGHEMTHGFDDEGRKFDAQGNLRDWWTSDDAKAFTERAQCLVDEYNGFVAVKDDNDPKNDVHLNGKLTLGENTADNGGVRIALMALKDTLAGKEEQKIDGFTPEQRLFLGFAQVWCGKTKPEAARQLALTNPHSLAKYRVIGVVTNMPEFQQAFSCKKGDAMVRENACRVW
jgi:endothelin-converting enzyme/putative endopeptidase